MRPSEGLVVDRRAFIGTVARGLVVAPLAAEGQQAGKMYRLGILGNVPLSDTEGARLWGALTQGLRELGYVEGQNLASTSPRRDDLSGSAPSPQRSSVGSPTSSLCPITRMPLRPDGPRRRSQSSQRRSLKRGPS